MDTAGTRIDSVMHSKIQRIRKWDYKTQFLTAHDRSLRQAFEELDVLKDKLQLSNATVEKTAYLYRESSAKTTHTWTNYFWYVMRGCVYCLHRDWSTKNT